MPPKHAHESTSSEGDEEYGMNMQKFFDVEYSTKFMTSLPEKVRQRAKVLMSYHEDFMKLQANSEMEEMNIRRRYDELYAPIFARRREIVTGTGKAVTEEEVRKGYPAEHDGQVSISESAADDTHAAESREQNTTEKTGLPGFWLRVLQHHVVFESIIKEYDVEVLRNLIDISSHIGAEGGFGSFEVVFTFAPNEYLVENTLTLTVAMDGDNSVIKRSPMTWKPGKNVTVQNIVKKQRSKQSNKTRTITREESRPSFFSYLFVDPKKNEDDRDEDEDEDEDKDEQVLRMLHELHMKIIPAAVNYYTGEAPDGSSDVEDDEENEDEEEESEEEDTGARRGR